MPSTFHGIELGKNSLITHQTALNVVGHNLANQSNPNYSRQRINMETLPPLYMPGLTRAATTGQIGQGVSVEEINRVRDVFIEDRIIHENGNVGYWETREGYLRQIEAIFNEPNGPSILTTYDDFVQQWNFLANNPTEGGAREAVRNSGIALSSLMNTTFNHLWTIRNNADAQIRADVDKINTLTDQLARLNNEITSIKAAGDNPNDLMDERDAIVNQLSNLVDARVSRSDQDEFIVYIGSQVLVQGNLAKRLDIVGDAENDGFAKIVWADNTQSEVLINSGRIGGLLEVRDKDVMAQIDQLDNLSANLINTVNAIHRDGFGLNFNTQLDFFRYRPITENVNGLYYPSDTDRDPNTMLFSVSGRTDLSMEDVVGTNGTINLGPSHDGLNNITIRYTETDTVQDIIEKINRSGADVVAYIDHRNKLTMKATLSSNPDYPNMVLRHIEDDGHFLTTFSGLLKENGPAGAFDWTDNSGLTKFQDRSNNDLPPFNYSVAYDEHPARWMSINTAILQDVNNIATGSGRDTDGDGINDLPNGHSDGTNALRIIAALVTENERSGLDILTEIDQNPVIQDKNTKSFRGLLSKMMEEVGITTRHAVTELEHENAILLSLTQTRESISGVNIDEELASMLMYQHGYQAAAKFVSVYNGLLETVINRMGV